MSKEVTYSVVARKNMLKKDDPAKYYAQAQASGDVGLDEISTRVEKACTVHSADVVAVLKALILYTRLYSAANGLLVYIPFAVFGAFLPAVYALTHKRGNRFEGR